MSYQLRYIRWTSGTNPNTGENDPQHSFSLRYIEYPLPTQDKCRDLASFLGETDYTIVDERNVEVYKTQSVTDHIIRRAAEDEEARRKEQEKVSIINARPERMVVHEFATGEKIVLKRLPAQIAPYSNRATCSVVSSIESHLLGGGSSGLELSYFRSGSRWMRQKFTARYRCLPCTPEIAANMETYWNKIKAAKAELIRTDAQ